MNVDYTSDYPVTDAACLAATGRSFADWFKEIENVGLSAKRREAIQHIYNATGRGKDVWWPTTIWVESERARGVVKKDGRPEGFNICCTKGFKQGPDLLFSHFESEEAFAAWVPGWSGKIEEGASFSCGEARGTVGRIRPGKDLRLAWQGPGFGPTEIEVQFVVADGKTTIQFYHKRIPSRAEADGLRRGWADALDRLKSRVG